MFSYFILSLITYKSLPLHIFVQRTCKKKEVERGGGETKRRKKSAQIEVRTHRTATIKAWSCKCVSFFFFDRLFDPRFRVWWGFCVLCLYSANRVGHRTFHFSCLEQQEQERNTYGLQSSSHACQGKDIESQQSWALFHFFFSPLTTLLYPLLQTDY